ncbi:MAG: spore coat protein [Clostridia bacterium]|nr:spore coat protein [Clostridia bacterium]
MALTQKETDLLKDMKGQEELCIQKYNKYSEMAKAEALKNLFKSMAQVEQNHLQTITAMMSGNIPTMPNTIENSNNQNCVSANYMSEADKNDDALLCQDMLATEKHVSGLYDTAIFEFKDPAARKTLNHIQAEEQQHGEQLYAYMNCNGMYS